MNILDKGRYRVWVDKHSIGDDIVLLVGGGEKPHIGGIVVCKPNEPAYILSLPKHRDVEALQLIASIVSRRYNTTCTAIGGIHIDDATKGEIERILDNCRKLAGLI